MPASSPIEVPSPPVRREAAREPLRREMRQWLLEAAGGGQPGAP